MTSNVLADLASLLQGTKKIGNQPNRSAIMTGAGVSGAILNVDPIISSNDANNLLNSVRSWAGFLRAIAIEFFKTYGSSELYENDVLFLLSFGKDVENVKYGDEKATNEFKKSIKAAVDNGIFELPQLYKAEEMFVKTPMLRFTIDRVLKSLPTKDPKDPKDPAMSSLLRKVALNPWGDYRSIDDSTKILNELATLINKTIFPQTSVVSVWKRAKDAIDKRSKEVKLEDIKKGYEEFAKFLAYMEKNNPQGFEDDFNITLTGIMSINESNLNTTLRRLTEQALNALRATLAKVGKNSLLMTTNYDTFMASALFRSPIDFAEDLIGDDQLNNFLIPEAHTRFVVHVHGLYYDKGRFVLSKEEYMQTRGIFVHFMHKLIVEKNTSLVFVGAGSAGITDYHFCNLYKELAKTLKSSGGTHPTHYWLVVSREATLPDKLEEVEGSQQEKKDAEDYFRKHIKVVSYGDSYDSLPTFLEGLLSPKSKV
ncbi:14555_t:CDS:2 [Ambispora leptoticha]|uniref:14555_t:CDS:1 n=1 Tax=Ambispora leptoticha TaxID=144679 RepID=A0A9N8VV00_9GLOM|nr:14555_t:CDS:2 [Ambispora leptoticha]